MQVKNFSGNGEGYKQKQNFGTLVPFGIHTLKVATNWSSKIMWVEVGGETVSRIISQSTTLKIQIYNL